MPDYLIFENTIEHWLTPARMPDPAQGHNITQPPTIRSRGDFEAFVYDLRCAADRVFGPTDNAR